MVEMGLKAWDNFTSWVTQGLFHVDFVELGWTCNTSQCLYIVDMNAAYEQTSQDAQSTSADA